MTKLRKLRIWITAAAILCVLAVNVMAAWGMENEITDGLLLAMCLVGAAGIAALVSNAVLAVRDFLLTRREQGDKSGKL